MKSFCLLLSLLVCLNPPPSRAAVFQYRVDAETSKDPIDAFLWLPAESPRIRGVVMAGMTSVEREIVKAPAVRAVCREAHLAIVFLRGGLASVDPQKVLDDLAQVSGYAELAAAPLFFLGHSAGGPQAKALAIRLADRCFGLMQSRGGFPGPHDPVPPGIPTLAMVGQFDEFWIPHRDRSGREVAWARPQADLKAYRAAHSGHLASLAVTPGAGHFVWSEACFAYFSQFLAAAAQARIPEFWTADPGDRPALKTIDPATGWLSDLDLVGAARHPAAPAEKYAGDPGAAAWHLNRELAEANDALHRGLIGRKDQFLRWQDRVWVDAEVRNFFTNPTWVGDGRTVRVHPEYATVYPQRGWQGVAGQPVEHSDSPIRLLVVGGPMRVVGPDTLQVHFDNLAPAGDRGRMTFLAYSAGNAQFRRTELVGMMPRGFSGFTQGQNQTLTFPELSDIPVNHPPVHLAATSSSGLPVEYYVAYGPAAVVNGRLEIQEVPRRAVYPIAVRVVAWQFGRGVDPLVQTAVPVERSFRILAP